MLALFSWVRLGACLVAELLLLGEAVRLHGGCALAPG